jgi:hypothetical protein
VAHADAKRTADQREERVNKLERKLATAMQQATHKPTGELNSLLHQVQQQQAQMAAMTYAMEAQRSEAQAQWEQMMACLTGMQRAMTAQVTPLTNLPTSLPASPTPARVDTTADEQQEYQTARVLEELTMKRQRKAHLIRLSVGRFLQATSDKGRNVSVAFRRWSKHTAVQGCTRLCPLDCEAVRSIVDQLRS